MHALIVYPDQSAKMFIHPRGDFCAILLLIIALFSCKQSVKNDPVVKGLEQRPFVIINQGFVLDTANADETFRLLSTIENSVIIDTIYTQLIKKLTEQSLYDLALQHLNKYKHSLTLGKIKMNAWSQYHSGELYYLKASYDSAASFLIEAIRLYELLRDSANLAASYNLFGSVCSFRGDNVQSAAYRYKALAVYESLGDSSHVNQVKLELGNNYYDQDDFKKAIELYSTSIDYFTRTGDSTNMSGAHAALASVYQQSKDIDNALVHAKAAVQIQRNLKDEYSLPEALNSLAVTYMRKKEWANAIPLLKEAFFYIEKTNDARQLPPILHNVGVCQAELGKTDSAVSAFHKSIAIAEKSGQRYGVLNTYKSLYKLSLKQQDYKSAVDYLKIVVDLNDSIYDTEKSKAINELNVRYETEKKEQEIVALNQSKKIEQERRRILIIFVTFCLLLAMMVVLYLASRNKKNKQLYEAGSRLQEQELNAVRRELEINRIRLQDFTQSLISKTSLIEELETKLRNGVVARQMTDEQFHTFVDEFSKMKFMTETDWNQFRLYFESVYPGLIQKVTTAYNQITSAELRLFLLIKLSIGNKEISSMLAISPDSVKKTRYRLKKKLNLSEDGSLDEFVLAFN